MKNWHRKHQLSFSYKYDVRSVCMKNWHRKHRPLMSEVPDNGFDPLHPLRISILYRRLQQ
ncbi:MAG: hypothetical protein K0R57_609 [Paenibacillaceae bacterium]|jgi:hypothetical protein|nr:hypothetical protein [Paenibacillaceae bacterium]